MKASDLYSSPFLKAGDLQKPIQVTISEIEIAEFTDQKTQQAQKRAVLSFAGAKKKLVLNRTQAGALMAAYGDELGAWPGRRVILAPGTAHNGQPTVIVSAVPDAPQEDAAGDTGSPF